MSARQHVVIHSHLHVEGHGRIEAKRLVDSSLEVLEVLDRLKVDGRGGSEILRDLFTKLCLDTRVLRDVVKEPAESLSGGVAASNAGGGD